MAEIDASNVTTRRLTVSWPAASDNVGVIGYRIWLNGFEVATTTETRAQLRWFNDDAVSTWCRFAPWTRPAIKVAVHQHWL